jgi:hypothetical protein
VDFKTAYISVFMDEIRGIYIVFENTRAREC